MRAQVRGLQTILKLTICLDGNNLSTLERNRLFVLDGIPIRATMVRIVRLVKTASGFASRERRAVAWRA